MKTSGKRSHKHRLLWLGLLVLVIGGYSYWALNRPLPILKPVTATVNLNPHVPSAVLPWPTSGEAAVGLSNTAVLASYGAQKPLPTASTAKLLTALSVLNQKPLSGGQPGPTITLGPADVAMHDSYVAEQGSVVPVTSGEQISEYQMLEAMMLPSANNMADSLAIWAFGSLTNYAAYANQYAKSLGLTSTQVGSDASGFSPTTTSTADDLVRLGQVAMRSPVLSQIVGQTSVSGIPNTSTVKNVNFLLGTDHIIGIKTGNTDQAGGVFISASQVVIDKVPLTIITAYIGAPTLYDAMSGSLPLITASQANFAAVNITQSDSVVGTYQLPWGGKVEAITLKPLSITTWRGQAVPAVIHLEAISSSTTTNQIVGLVTGTGLNGKFSVPINLQKSPSPPPIWWRLVHPF
jgi:serine-type D-Ala-D-Ala carboxypeptidase (penicillin-binding protein 5/6)